MQFNCITTSNAHAWTVLPPSCFPPSTLKADFHGLLNFRYRPYIVFRTVVTPRRAGEDSCSRFSARTICFGLRTENNLSPGNQVSTEVAAIPHV